VDDPRSQLAVGNPLAEANIFTPLPEIVRSRDASSGCRLASRAILASK